MDRILRQNPDSGRDQIIIRTSWVGIGANLLLAGFKALVGLLSHSIAVVLDAVNNLSDALSSVITIIGTKLAGKAPDRKHPLGYGRIEYMSAIIIAVIILYAGITSLVESVKSILKPEAPDYSAVTLIVVGAAVGVKLFLGSYVKRKGEQVNSDALIASGTDARFDAILSSATLAAAIISLIWHVNLEAYLAAIISLVLLKSGFGMLLDTISSLLGERVDSDLSHAVRQTIAETSGVLGVYDLVFHDYGPDSLLASVHVEVPDSFTAVDIDRLTREVQRQVAAKHQVMLTAVGIYAFNTRDAEVAALRDQVRTLALSVPGVMQMHGFYADMAAKTLRFDLVVDFDAADRLAVWREACEKIRAALPGWELLAIMDADLSD